MNLETLVTPGMLDAQTMSHMCHGAKKVSSDHHEVIIDCGEEMAQKISN